MYSNGTTKEEHPNRSVVYRYDNGDVQQVFADQRTVYKCEDGARHASSFKLVNVFILEEEPFLAYRHSYRMPPPSPGYTPHRGTYLMCVPHRMVIYDLICACTPMP